MERNSTGLTLLPSVWCVLLLSLVLAGCAVEPPIPKDQSLFGGRIDLGKVKHDPLTEVSGIAASRQYANVLWVHNDSGDSNRVYALNRDGNHLGEYTIEGCQSRDWEDVAIGPGPDADTDYLYVGDIGDNLGIYELKYICRVPEPRVNQGQTAVEERLRGADVITFQYPDGTHDAETLMVDPRSRDIYIVTKREKEVLLFRLPYPQATDKPLVAEHVATLPMTRITGGDISPDGSLVLLKTYNDVLLWARGEQEDVATALSKQPVLLPYIAEPQGEAIGWNSDGSGYYTVSEEKLGLSAHLYYYPKLQTRQ